MLRLFIGIPLPDRLQTQVQALVGRLGAHLHSRVRWTRPGNAHLTLKFLGNAKEDMIEDLDAVLSTVKAPTFDITFDTCGCHPDDAAPRVVWVALKTGAAHCTALAHAVENAVEPLGFKANTRPFKPHLTLGRVTKPARDDWAARLRKTDTHAWPGFRADAFILWKSDLTPDGPIYTPLKTFKLTTPQRP